MHVKEQRAADVKCKFRVHRRGFQPLLQKVRSVTSPTTRGSGFELGLCGRLATETVNLDVRAALPSAPVFTRMAG